MAQQGQVLLLRPAGVTGGGRQEGQEGLTCVCGQGGSREGAAAFSSKCVPQTC